MYMENVLCLGFVVFFCTYKIHLFACIQVPSRLRFSTPEGLVGASFRRSKMIHLRTYMYPFITAICLNPHH